MATVPLPPRWAVVDASVRVSRFLPADVHHARSRQWIEDHLANRRRVLAPTLFLVEVAGAIGRRAGDPAVARRAADSLRALPGLIRVGLPGDVRDHAAELAAILRLRGADAVYVAIADRLRVPLVTWDAEQLSRASVRVATLTPG
jgi:predicted nucleic acid-binding protein